MTQTSSTLMSDETVIPDPDVHRAERRKLAMLAGIMAGGAGTRLFPLTRDRATAALVKEADEAMKRGDAQVALAKAQEVLKTNPSQREARAIVRAIISSVIPGS